MHGPGALADRANCREVVLPATSFNPSLAAYRTWPRWPGSAKWLWLRLQSPRQPDQFKEEAVGKVTSSPNHDDGFTNTDHKFPISISRAALCIVFFSVRSDAVNCLLSSCHRCFFVWTCSQWSSLFPWRNKKWQSSIRASQCGLIGVSILVWAVCSH